MLCRFWNKDIFCERHSSCHGPQSLHYMQTETECYTYPTLVLLHNQVSGKNFLTRGVDGEATSDCDDSLVIPW